jgi:hypothetical protein
MREIIDLKDQLDKIEQKKYIKKHGLNNSVSYGDEASNGLFGRNPDF